METVKKKTVKKQWRKIGSDILFYVSGILFMYYAFLTKDVHSTVVSGFSLSIFTITTIYFEIIDALIKWKNNG